MPSMTPKKHTLHPGATQSGTTYNRPAEEAKRLHISRRQLTNWMQNRTVPFIKRGRVILFDPGAVDAALAKFETVEATRP